MWPCFRGQTLRLWLFGPALALVGHVQDLQGVAEVIQQVDKFFVRLLNDKELIPKLIADEGGKPTTFLQGSHLERYLTELSKPAAAIRNQVRKVHQQLDASEVNNNLRIQAAQMLKVNHSMSGDAFTNQAHSPAFCSQPSVVTWIQPSAATGYRTQINVAKRADNIPNESSFAYADSQFDRNKNTHLERINARLMFKKNGTNEFLRGLPEDQRDRAMAVCTQVRATDAVLQGMKEHKEQQKVALQEKQRKDLVEAAEAQQKEQELRMLFNDKASIPTVETLPAFLRKGVDKRRRGSRGSSRCSGTTKCGSRKPASQRGL